MAKLPDEYGLNVRIDVGIQAEALREAADQVEAIGVGMRKLADALEKLTSESHVVPVTQSADAENEPGSFGPE